MSELGDMRPRVLNALRAVDAVAIENRVGTGTPDVECTLGWLELKWLRHWPKRASTVVKLKHYKREQRLWLQRRWDKGGLACLLLQHRREWLLYAAPNAQRVGMLTRAQLYATADYVSNEGLKSEELIACLRRLQR